MLAVALPGSGRSTWLRQSLAAFGGPVVSAPLPGSTGATISLVGAGRVGPELAALVDRDDLLASGMEAVRRWPGAVLVGVDDAHLIAPDLLRRAPTLLEELLRTTGFLVATSRWKLDLPTAQGRVHGWLCEIDDDDLAFTLEELAEAVGLDPSVGGAPRADLARFHEATSGWATAAGALARAVRRGEPLPDGFTDDLAAHLADLVLADLDPLDEPTLLLAAGLRWGSPALVQATSGVEAARRFAHLRSRHPAFVARADDGTWSRLHPLLERGLQPRLEGHAHPLVADVVGRAVTWHRDAGHLREPIELLLAAHRWTEAVALLVESSLRFAEDARHQEFLALWGEIPTPAWERDPVAVLTIALIQPGAGHAESAFDLLFRPPLTDFDLPDGTRAIADVAQALLAPWSPDPGASLAAAERAIDTLDRVDQADLPPVCGVRTRTHWHHLAALGAARAEVAMGRGAAAAQRLGILADDHTLGPLVRLNQLSLYARALAQCGRLEAATEQADAAIERAQRRTVPHHPGLVDAYLARAEVALWRNDLAEALTTQAEAEQRARRNHCPTQVAAARTVHAGVALRRGEPERALRVLAGVHGVPEGQARRSVEALRTRALHRTGETGAARRLAASLPLAPETVLARAEVHVGSEAELLTWRPEEEPATQVLTPLALAVYRQRSEGDDAWTYLAEALHRAEPHGLLGPFAELPAALMVTLAALPSDGPFAASALAAAQRGTPLATEVPPLTRTEIAVLTALATPVPLREVADHLFVSTNTLKSHLRRIYRKLGATSRADAVARARRLGLT